MTEKEHHRVHFGEDSDSFGKDNDIVIQSTGENKVSVHLGFLKLCHRYEIKVDVPRALCGFGQEAEISEHNKCQVPNVNCKICNLSCDENIIHLMIQLFAHKEQLLKEEVSLESGDNSVCHITLVARVLGKGKGTPLLKNGIHCIANEEMDDESEASDWYGFD